MLGVLYKAIGRSRPFSANFLLPAAFEVLQILYSVSEELNLYQQEPKSCTLPIKLETHIYMRSMRKTYKGPARNALKIYLWIFLSINICNTLARAICAGLIIFSKTNALYLNSKISRIGPQCGLYLSATPRLTNLIITYKLIILH